MERLKKVTLALLASLCIAGTAQAGVLGDRVWEDLNNNGIQDCEDANGNGILGDVDANDPANPAVSDQGPECGDRANGGAGIAGVAVNLFQPDGVGDCTINLSRQVMTGTDGLYLFDDLEPGDYCVKFIKPGDEFCQIGDITLGDPQFTATNAGNDDAIDSDADRGTGVSDAVNLAAGESNLTVDAGIVCPATIGDRVWEDTNQNGLQDNGEPGVEGVTVRLFECGPDGIAGTSDDVDTGESRVSDAIDGLYMFGAEPGVFELPPGDYYVKFDLTTYPPGSDFTVPKVGSGDDIDSDCLPPDGISACTTLGSRGINLQRDCGIINPAPPLTHVTIDIKPGSDPNCFNINGHGAIPVAILGTEDFDVTEIDLASLSFGGLEVRVRGNKGPLCSVEYSNNDPYLDLVCHFEDDSESWVPGDGEATLTGNLLDEQPIEGSDSICIVP